MSKTHSMSYSSFMKHKPKSDAWTTLQNRAKKLCIAENTIDWQKQTFCDVAFHAFPLDFRSKEGKSFRKKCTLVGTTTQLKQFTVALAKLANHNHNHTVDCSKDWTVYPESILLRIHYRVLRWWHTHCRKQKGTMYRTHALWKNEVDPVSQENFTTLPTAFLFTYIDMQNCVYAFDIRTLNKLFMNQMMTNPFTKESFPECIVETVHTRISRLTKLGYNVSWAIHTKTNRILEITQLWDKMGYHITVEDMEALTPTQLILWYIRCEDTWNWRAQLNNDMKARIVPDMNVFPMKLTIKTYANRKTQLCKHVLDAMHKLVTNGVSDADKMLGSMYVIGALTECSPTFRKSFPELYQPP